MNAHTAIARVCLVTPLLVSACARPPRPTHLATADQASRSPASIEAAELTPQAFANAERLRANAEQAYENGQLASADILAERAQVAYERAAILARIVRSSTLLEGAKQQLSRQQNEIRELEAEQARLTADVEALEARVKAGQDAEPLVPAGRADPAREAARMSAVHSILTDGRLLCASALLLANPTGQSDLDSAVANVQKIEASLQAGVRTAPIDEARRARARCLAALAAKRQLAANASSGAADMVLSELAAQTSLSPVRDERGVVVNLSPGSCPPQLTAIALKHPDYPLLIVSFVDRRSPKTTPEAVSSPAQALVADFVKAGIASERIRVERVETDASPTARKRPSNGPKLQLVFISPQS